MIQTLKKLKWDAALLSAALVSSSAIAGGAIPAAPTNHYYGEIFGGVAWTQASKRSENVTLVAPLVTNRYELSRDFVTGPVVGLGFGYIWNVSTVNSISLGIDSFYTRSLSKAGRVRPLYLINPGFDTLNFRYAVSSIPLLLVSRIAYHSGNWAPYVLLGLGVSWNRASDYQETPTEPSAGALAMRSPFNPHRTLDFAYTGGVGVGYMVNNTTEVGIEYRYMNYGHARLDTSPAQSTGETLSLGDQSSHMVLLRLSEQFN